VQDISLLQDIWDGMERLKHQVALGGLRKSDAILPLF